MNWPPLVRWHNSLSKLTSSMVLSLGPGASQDSLRRWANELRHIAKEMDTYEKARSDVQVGPSKDASGKS